VAWHAKLPASSSKRWIACTGSVVGNPPSDGGSSFYGLEGTCAHKLGEVCLSRWIEGEEHGIEPEEYVGCVIYILRDADGEELEPVITTAEEWEHEDGLPLDHTLAIKLVVDDDFVSAVKVYTDYVSETFNRLCNDVGDSNVQLLIERRFDLDELHEGLGGTADAVIVSECDTLHVIDLKFGRGHLVEVEDNEQLMTYGLGALLEHPLAESITVTIVQPRAKHSDGPIRSQVFDARELESFGNDTLVPAARACFEAIHQVYEEELDPASIPREAGSHCTFCPQLPFCPEAKGHAVTEALDDFGGEAPELPLSKDDKADIKEVATSKDDEALAEAMELVPFLDQWIKAVTGEA